jgi:hypothetical protein
MPSRTDAIEGTTEPVKGLPVKLYQMPASRFWQCSVWKDGHFIRRSTRTEKKLEAIRFAKNFYDQILLKKAQQLPLTHSATFEVVATDLLAEDQGRVDRGEAAKTLVTDARYIFNADLLPFFKTTHVKDVNYKLLTDYVVHLKTRGKKPISSKTVKNHFILLSKILKHSHKLGYIDKLPIFPTITAKDNPREWLSDDQYKKLIKITNEQIGKKVRFVELTAHLRYLIEFTVNSFLRPPDIKTLKNKQITVVKGRKGNFLRIMAYSKVKPAQVVTMPIAATIYAKLAGKPEDYVFFPEYTNRSYAMQTMNRLFNHVLTIAGLKEGPNGAPRTLYSLRHTCIMNTLLRSKNINLLTLARNCRTSVEMLERFYASQLTAEMNVHQLHEQEDLPEAYTIFDELFREEPNA